MRTLFICRHAEAETHYDQDFSRCLTVNGKKEAAWLGEYLLKHQINIDSIINSPAQRAITTSEIIAQKLSISPDNCFTIPDIYSADILTLLNIIRSISERYYHPLVIGHNPALSSLIEYLTDTDIGHLPTCGICGLDFDIDSWQHVSRGNGQLRLISCPGAE